MDIQRAMHNRIRHDKARYDSLLRAIMLFEDLFLLLDGSKMSGA